MQGENSKVCGKGEQTRRGNQQKVRNLKEFRKNSDSYTCRMSELQNIYIFIAIIQIMNVQ